MKVRRIWAVTSDRDFYAFKRKMREEQDLSMGQALAGLVHLIVRGELTVDLRPHRALLDKLQAEADAYVGSEEMMHKQNLEDALGIDGQG